MIALVTDQGTAMAEYALCGLHARSERWRNETIEEAGVEASLDAPADRWNGGGFVQVDGNSELECRVCGEDDRDDE